MERLKQIYNDVILFLTDIKGIDPDMFEYGISFGLKMFGLEEMHRRTLEKIKELEEAQKKESAGADVIFGLRGIYIARQTDLAWKKSIAYFEAYLNALYSLLQVITKITLIIYRKTKKPIATEQMGDNFGTLVNYLKNNKTIDTDFANYIDGKMGWYDIFRSNRHKITHNGSAFLMFDPDGKVTFLDYQKTESKLLDQTKSIKNLADYLIKSFEDVFDFLDFYVKHFRKWTS
jgi:hypothetical protein